LVNIFISIWYSHYNIGVITGPCHAEVCLERLSYLTIACGDANKAKVVAQALIRNYIKTKITDDIIGKEYAAMLKKIFTQLQRGLPGGLGMATTNRFWWVMVSARWKNSSKVHKMKRNINDSAYLGDLLVTGYSVF
jgi:glycerol-3-phosphate dehydrogenase (NAD(P)+)